MMESLRNSDKTPAESRVREEGREDIKHSGKKANIIRMRHFFSFKLKNRSKTICCLCSKSVCSGKYKVYTQKEHLL